MDNTIPQDTTPRKRCYKCQELKLRTSEHFGSDKRSGDGFRNCCKSCRRIEREDAFARNPNKHKQAYQKELAKPYEEQERLKAVRAAYMRQRRKKSVATGLCGNCGIRPFTQGNLCAQCFAYHKKWKVNNVERRFQLSRIERERLRKEVLEAYGNACQCCGETQYEFLSIDHVNNDGKQHRSSIKGNNVYRWLRKNGYPKEGFQILCHNCNMAKAFYGCCPHQRIIQFY